MPFKSEKQRRYLFANEPEVAKKFSEDYNKGGVASMFRKKQADGTDPQYEGWKKIYETNPELAALNDKHDEYLEKYTLEMSTSDAGEAGILGTEEANMEFVEADDGEEVMVDDRINLMAAAPEKQPFLSSDQSATTLFMNKGGKATKNIKGQPHMLAYITPGEAKTLENLGGQKTMTKEGIPAYPPSDNYGGTHGSSDKTGSGDKDRPNPHTPSGTSKTSTKAETKTSDEEPTPQDIARGNQWKNAPKTRNKTITGTITKGPKAGETYTYTTPVSYQDYNKKDLFSSRTGFGKKGKDTWHESAVKNINKNIKDVDKTLNPSKFGLLDIVLTIGSLGLINPAVTKVAKSISNVKTAFNVANLVSKKTKTKGVKETVKDVLTSTAKKEISKKTGIDVKTIDTTIDTIQKALDTEIGKAVVDKFNSFNTTNKNTAKNNTTKTTTFNGGDNDGSNNAIIPVVPEFLEEKVIVEEPTSSLSDLATLRLIRDRQARRKSFFNANSGGLAGLFKVKKQ
jgi:hypothetical protein